jgi:predicted NBD/HSP70 family sugar kinase
MNFANKCRTCGRRNCTTQHRSGTAPIRQRRRAWRGSRSAGSMFNLSSRMAPQLGNGDYFRRDEAPAAIVGGERVA